MAKKYDALPVDPTARDAEVNYRLVDGVLSLFETHALEVKMNPADKETLQRSLEEGMQRHTIQFIFVPTNNIILF